jgi:hypothetical protein
MSDTTFFDDAAARRIVYGPQGPTPAQLRALRALDALYEHVNAMPKQSPEGAQHAASPGLPTSVASGSVERSAN